MPTRPDVGVRSDGVVKIAGCVLLSVLSAWVLVGCGGGDGGGERTAISWPAGTGYVSEAKNRPSSPYRFKTSTKAQIIAVGEKRIRLGPESRLELKESRTLLFAPGAEVSYVCTSPDKFEFKDYNRDACLLATGITIWVNEYGEFVPIRYRPEDGVAPPSGEIEKEAKMKGGTHTDRTGVTVFSGVFDGEQFVRMEDL